MKDALIVSALSLFPRKTGARWMGVGARSSVSRLVTRAFAHHYRLDMTECELPLADYPTLEALFTRKLKPGARFIDPTPGAVVSPVDGVVAALGTTEKGKIPLTDRRVLDLSELLGRPLSGEREVAVLYLSPQDYHRVHVPQTGHITRWDYKPGTLWPVFPAALRRIDGLFSRNERVVVTIDSAIGEYDVVLVGAFGVGRITLEGLDLTTNAGQSGGLREVEPMPVYTGGPLGIFHLGSTVIVSLPPGKLRWQTKAGERITMGMPLGHPLE